LNANAVWWLGIPNIVLILNDGDDRNIDVDNDDNNKNNTAKVIVNDDNGWKPENVIFIPFYLDIGIIKIVLF
jgi:hypothetical protein